jgi:hypothetical protein
MQEKRAGTPLKFDFWQVAVVFFLPCTAFSMAGRAGAVSLGWDMEGAVPGPGDTAPSSAWDVPGKDPSTDAGGMPHNRPSASGANDRMIFTAITATHRPLGVLAGTREGRSLASRPAHPTLTGPSSVLADTYLFDANYAAQDPKASGMTGAPSFSSGTVRSGSASDTAPLPGSHYAINLFRTDLTIIGIHDYVAPEPASLAVFGLAGLLLLRRPARGTRGQDAHATVSCAGRPSRAESNHNPGNACHPTNRF